MNFFTIRDYFFMPRTPKGKAPRSSQLQVSRNPDDMMKRQKSVSTYRDQEFPDLFRDTSHDPLLSKAVEQSIGVATVPVGFAGPTSFTIQQVEESEKRVLTDSEIISDVIFPLATTEATLVASINRGLKLCSTGNIQVVVEKKGITRTPAFRVDSVQTAFEFSSWLNRSISIFNTFIKKKHNHVRLTKLICWTVGRTVFTRFSADTTDAMGMNSMSIALDECIESIIAPKWKNKITYITLSSNLCTDKKPNIVNSLFGRGWWVQAECEISSNDLDRMLGVSVEAFLDLHRTKNHVGSGLAGAAQNAHVANVVSALFIATGQDPAHVVEAAYATTTFEKTKNGIYAAVTIPSLQVGTVGGGTKLGYAKDAIKLMNVSSTAAFAGSIGVACLAGELSLIGALTQHTLGKSHAEFREKTT